MTTYEFGDVVLVPFPFTDQSGVKKRPAIIVNSANYSILRPDVIVLAATSRLKAPPTELEHVVRDWKTSGFPKASMLKPVILTVEQQLLLTKLGMLSEFDRQGALRVIRAMLATG